MTQKGNSNVQKRIKKKNTGKIVTKYPFFKTELVKAKIVALYHHVNK